MRLCIGIIISLGFMLSSITSAQNVSYAYDAAGFRVKRELVVERSPRNGKQKVKSQTLYDSIDNKTVKLTVSPTGELTVSVAGFEAGDNGVVTVYDNSGALILCQNIVDGISVIDLHPYGAEVVDLLYNR